jgi:hypothetical protein
MKIKSATPVLLVDRVEPTQDFFTKLGFTVLFDVPDGDQLVSFMEPGGHIVTFAKIDR